MPPLVIAHRGASALASHENTLEAFQIAIDIKADMAEFDIRKTKDNQLVVFHDRELDGIPVSGLTYSQMNELAAKENYRIPLLEEVLKLCKGKIYLDVEIKETGFEARVLDMLLKRFGYSYDEFSIKSFEDKVPLRVKQLDERVRTGLLLGRSKLTLAKRLSEYFPLKRLKDCRADFVSPEYRFLTWTFIRRMKLTGYAIYAWTINEAGLMKKMERKGIDAVITDYPDVALQVYGRE